MIRLGFEPKTHSLEGCCSIQLSYRTDPCLLLTCSSAEVKSGCKYSDYFWICNTDCRILLMDCSLFITAPSLHRRSERIHHPFRPPQKKECIPIPVGFDEADGGFIHHCGDFIEYCHVAVGGVGAVGDDDAGTVFECDTFTAQKFQTQSIHIQRPEGDLGGFPKGSVEVVSGGFIYAGVGSQKHGQSGKPK